MFGARISLRAAILLGLAKPYDEVILEDKWFPSLFLKKYDLESGVILLSAISIK